MSADRSGDPANVTTPLTRSVIAASATTPVVIQTSVPHLFNDNDYVEASGIFGTSGANGVWKIVVLAADTFSLTGSVGGGSYTGGGTIVDRSLTPTITRPADGDLRSAASVNASLDALADRTQFLALLGTLRRKTFTASGSWTAPANCQGLGFVRHRGGGGGGGGAAPSGTVAGETASGGGGGGQALEVFEPVVLVGGTVYTVTIGAGGAGGAASSSGTYGSDTTFGSLSTAVGGGAGSGSSNTPVSTGRGHRGGATVGTSDTARNARVEATTASQIAGLVSDSPGAGGAGLDSVAAAIVSGASLSGNIGTNTQGRGNGGNAGATVSTYKGGGGGGGGGGIGGGAGGVGGAGNNGGAGGNGVAGTAATANTGSGGGGGGAGGQGSTSGGTAAAGGAGGSGTMTIYYFGDPS